VADTNASEDSNQPLDPSQVKPVDTGLTLCSNLEAPREGKCIDGKSKYVVVNRGSELQLPELDARLVSIDTAETLADVGVTRPDGVYVVLTLAITNRLTQPVAFDENQNQVTLSTSVGRDYNLYSEDFDAENGGDEDSFLWQSKEIQPDTTQTGTVIFDLPPKAVETLDKDGNVNVLNFSDAELFGSGRPRLPVGVFRTYEP